jgi:hypothetical protein
MKKFDTQRKVVFASMSRNIFYLREHIVKYILEAGHTPTCAFMMFSYYLLDTVERIKLIDANNDLIKRSDELWVFGDISDGVREEIILAGRIGIPVLYYDILKGSSDIKGSVRFEKKRDNGYEFK